MMPSDPSAILTAMCEAQKETKRRGQMFTVLTADQQLYCVIVHVKWAYPKLFEILIPRLGGMHMLMSFVGCVGTLMADTGLKEVMESAFGGMTKLLSGKNFPQNIWALRLLVEELLRSIRMWSDSSQTDDALCLSRLLSCTMGIDRGPCRYHAEFRGHEAVGT